MRSTPICEFFMLAVAVTAVSAAEPSRYFGIRVVDSQTGRGVPLVELRTVHNTRYYTDSNGLVAFLEPGLMGRKVFYFVQSHGYEFAKDGFGFAGVSLEAREGTIAEIKIARRNLAERLYRVTGAGIYADSVLLGQPVPLREPLLNGRVTGQDSVMAVPWGDRLWWFWGDTNRPGYPLGHFQTSGATSALPGRGGLDPGAGVNLDYFVDQEGFSRPMCPMAAPGPIWIEGLLVARDAGGTERLATHYSRMKDLGAMLEHGVMVFDEKDNAFKKYKQLDLGEKWRFPQGHPFLHQEGDASHYLLGNPFVVARVKPELRCVVDPACYEAFTCLKPGSRYQKGDSQVERAADGHLVYAWKPDTDPVAGAEERELMKAGTIRPEEVRYQPRDLESGKPIEIHFGSVTWNPFRKKWIMIAVQQGGPISFLGEVWYSESDAPTGPWMWARKIVTHDKYSFYNPVHHPFFDQQGGRIIYFEGTYASTFSGNPCPTPRYDYNQIMYRLDLADPRLTKRDAK